MNKQEKIRVGTLFALLAATLWAINIVITKFIIKAGENPINIVFWLAIIASPYWISLFINKRDEIRKASKKDILILLGIGIIANLFVSVVEIFALKYTQAVNFSFLIRSTLIFTFVFATLFLNEKITYKKVFLALFILIGAYLVATSGKILSFSLGDTLTLIEAVLLAFGNTILGKIAAKTMSPQLSSSGSFIFGLLPVIIFTISTKSFAIPHTWTLLVVLSVLCIISNLVRFTAYKYCTASFLAMTYSLTPVLVTIIAFFMLGERLTLAQFFGGLLIVASGIYAEKIKL